MNTSGSPMTAIMAGEQNFVSTHNAPEFGERMGRNTRGSVGGTGTSALRKR